MRAYLYYSWQKSDTDTGRIFNKVCETGEACLYFSWQNSDTNTSRIFNMV